MVATCLAAAMATVAAASAQQLPSAAAPMPACGVAAFNNTLGFLSPLEVKAVAAKDAAACCASCLASRSCSSWSMQHEWTPKTPCHLSPYAFLRKKGGSQGNSCGTARAGPAAPPSPTPRPHPPPPAFSDNGAYTIDMSAAGRRQVVEGVQVELQADSIGSDNTGMPGDGAIVPDDSPTAIGCPHDLSSSERIRFATEVIKGARSIRLAMGLYLRGLGTENKSIVGRWPSQMAELKQLQDLSQIDGWAPEYWSPPSGWKSSQSYYTGTLASFNASFLDEFGDGVRRDVDYLRQHGLKVTWWGLQNEPGSGPNTTTSCPPVQSQPPQGGRGAAVLTGATGMNLTEGVKANSYSMCRNSQGPCTWYR